jgi:hypothetical protein
VSSPKRALARRKQAIFFFAVFGLIIATFEISDGKSLPKQIISGADGASITISLTKTDIQIEYRAPDSDANTAVFVALGTHRDIGSAVVPFQREQEGSTVFLPFKADLLLSAKLGAEATSCVERKWTQWKWSDASASTSNRVKIKNGTATFQLSRSQFTEATTINCAIYAKDFSQNDGWGKLFGCSDPSVESGLGDQYIPQYFELNLAATGNQIATLRARYNRAEAKVRIYQLFVRLFGNTN